MPSTKFYQGFSPALRMVIALAAVVIIGAGVRTAAPILNPLILALFIALMFTPLLRWLIERNVPRWLALLMVIALILVGGIVLILLVASSLGQLVEALPQYQEQLALLTAQVADQLESFGIDSDILSATSIIRPSSIISFSAGLIASLTGTIAVAGLTLVFTAYMLIESTSISRKVHSVAEENSRFVTQLDRFAGSVRDYMNIRVLAGAAAGFLDIIFLMLIGVDFAILWGILSFLMSFIPSIGFMIALIPPLLIALLSQGLQGAILVILGYWFINGMIDTVLAPRFMGEGLDMSPLVIMISLTLWAWLLGPTGAIMAVPLTMIVKQVILEGYEDTRWMGVLLSMGRDSDEPVEEKSGEVR